MATIIHRSALVFHGHNPEPEVAYVVSDYRGRRTVTWQEVLDKRREWQREILRRKRGEYEPVWKPYKLWVQFFDMDLFGGWQAFIENRDRRLWIDRDGRGLKAVLMKLFPLVLNFGDSASWERWKIAFATQFKRREKYRRPVGVAYVWWDGSNGEIRVCAK
jgi:hypothetical protein